ncbi:MAG: DUF1475 family protein [Bacteriovoracaceae bacterium]
MNNLTKSLPFFLLFLLMLGTTIWASSQQNLFTEFSWSGSPMWFKATIIDFYINQIILWFWVVYLEKSAISKGVWLVLFICFGSMGTTAYIIYRLLAKKPLFQKELA